jgi:hypothetical protein
MSTADFSACILSDCSSKQAVDVVSAAAKCTVLPTSSVVAITTARLCHIYSSNLKATAHDSYCCARVRSNINTARSSTDISWNNKYA